MLSNFLEAVLNDQIDGEALHLELQTATPDEVADLIEAIRHHSAHLNSRIEKLIDPAGHEEREKLRQQEQNLEKLSRVLIAFIRAELRELLKFRGQGGQGAGHAPVELEPERFDITPGDPLGGEGAETF